MKNLLLFILLTTSLIDKELFGLRISQICIIFLIPFLLKKKIFIPSKNRNIFYFALIYSIASVYTFKSYLASFIILNIGNLILCILAYNLLKDSKISWIRNFIKKYLILIIILLIMDVILSSFLGVSPFTVFSTNPIEGYRNHQLFSNEPNWLSMLIVSLNVLRKAVEIDKKTDRYDWLTLLIILILESRIFILFQIVGMILQYNLKKINLKTVTLVFISSFLIVSAFTFIIDDFLYDIIDLNKNPRLNDFLFFNNQVSKILFFNFEPGNLFYLSENLTWREIPQTVVNSSITQFYFNFGIIGLILLYRMLFFKSNNSQLIFLGVLLIISSIFHNHLFRHQFWIILSIMYMVDRKYIINNGRIKKNIFS